MLLINSRFYCGLDVVPNVHIIVLCDKVDVSISVHLHTDMITGCFQDCTNGRDEENCNFFYCRDEGTTKYLDFEKVSEQ